MRYHRQHSKSLLGTEAMQHKHHLIWLGDFNRHHMYWDRLEDNRLFTKDACKAAEALLKAVADQGMDMALAKGSLTHQHNMTKNWSRLNQVFMMEQTLEAVIVCNMVLEERGINTDHLPIIRVINVEVMKAPTQIMRNFKDVEWKKFCKTAGEKQDGLGPPKYIKTLNTLSCMCEELTRVVQKTIDKEVLHTLICARSKH